MKYQMEDGAVINTEKAKNTWKEARDWNGSNRIGRSSKSQWHYQELHESRKGRFYIEYLSAVQGQMSRCEWVSEHEAVRWLLLNEIEVPERLQHLIEEVEE